MAKEIKESIVAPATVEKPVYDAAEIAANAQHLFGYNATSRPQRLTSTMLRAVRSKRRKNSSRTLQKGRWTK